MTNSQRLATVRAHLRGWLADNAADHDQQPNIVGESIVVRDGFYCGRSFDVSPFRAVWFIEEDELKVHGPTGEVVATFSAEEIMAPTPVESPVAEITTTADVIQMPSTTVDESRRAA